MNKNAIRASQPRSDHHTRTLADALPVFASFIDREERYQLVNRTYEEWFGVPAHAILGKTVREVLGEEAYAARKPQLEAALQGERVRFETFTPKPDGSVRETEMEYLPRIAPDGQPDGLYVLGTDITERKRSERALQHSEARLRIALDAAQMAVWEIDIATEQLWGSRELNRVLGFPEDTALTLQDVRSRYYPGEQQRLKAATRTALERGDRHTETEFRYLWPDGSVRWLMLRAEVYLTEAGVPSRYVGVVHDITERKRADDALRRSEALKGAILNAALDCIITITDDSCIIEWNAAAERTFGYARDVVLGRDLTELIIPPEYRDAHRRGMKHYLATGHGPVLENRIEIEALRADGTRFPVELAINVIHIDERPHFTAYLRDITDRKRAEAEQRETEQRLRATYEHAFVGIAEVDGNGRFLRVNEQFCFITGYEREELLSRSFWEITHPDDRAADLEQFHRQMAGDVDAYTIEKRYIHKDGHVVWIELSASKVNDATGWPLYGVRVVRDVTERRRAEEHQRLLLNELNHRVKNTLATVQSITSQTLRTAATNSEARAAIERRLIALSLAHDVLTRENWEGANLRQIVEQAIEPFRTYGEHRLHWEGPSVRLSPRIALAIAMALQELATNASKYGALTNAEGEVHLSWSVSRSKKPPRLRFTWREVGGPPVTPPTTKGFGSRLIERSLAADLNGKVMIEYDPKGLVCSVDAPLET
jgi:PAS domain S-box-containing protein